MEAELLEDGAADADGEAHDEVNGEANGKASVDIRLNGSKILHDHCTFENVDGVVTWTRAA